MARKDFTFSFEKVVKQRELRAFHWELTKKFLKKVDEDSESNQWIF